MKIQNYRTTTQSQHRFYKTELINWIAEQGFTHGLSISHHAGVRPDHDAANRCEEGTCTSHTKRPRHIIEQDRKIAIANLTRRGITIERATADVKRLHRNIDRRLLGCRFNLSADRTYGLYVLEGTEDMANIHIHALLKIAHRNTEKFEGMFSNDVRDKSIWNRIAPSGTHKLIINNRPLAAATYITKFVHMNMDADRLIFSHDFISANSKIAI